MPPLTLAPVDSLEILSIIDNELDPISPAPPIVQAFGRLGEIGVFRGEAVPGRGDGAKEIKMSQVCCGAHGLSLMITATKDGKPHTLLFDTGPEEEAFERNARRLAAPLHTIERIHLSHWHRDHSGGMLKAIEMINKSKASQETKDEPLVVDLHPSRPPYRGVLTPAGPLSLEADPTFSEMSEAGAVVEKSDSAHAVLDAYFGVSGEIPRHTPYEHGIKGGIRFSPSTATWTPDRFIRDERLVLVHLRDKGLVVFTGCSHAGVVNVAKHAVELVPGIPLYAIVGGYHLADAEESQIRRTVEEFKGLGVRVLLAGHCTGWRAKFEIEREMGGALVPGFVGMRVRL